MWSDITLHLLSLRVPSWNELRPKILSHQFILLCLWDRELQLCFGKPLFLGLFKTRIFISRTHTHKRNSGLYIQLVTSMIMNRYNLFVYYYAALNFSRKKKKFLKTTKLNVCFQVAYKDKYKWFLKELIFWESSNFGFPKKEGFIFMVTSFGNF